MFFLSSQAFATAFATGLFLFPRKNKIRDEILKTVLEPNTTYTLANSKTEAYTTIQAYVSINIFFHMLGSAGLASMVSIYNAALEKLSDIVDPTNAVVASMHGYGPIRCASLSLLPTTLKCHSRSPKTVVRSSAWPEFSECQLYSRTT